LALLPSCTNTSVTPNSIGRPGLRLADFVSQFGDRGKFYSVCASDYSPTFADIGTQLFDLMSSCLDGAIDRSHFDPAAPGQKLDCTVADVGDQTEVPVSPCQMQAGPSSVGTDTCTTGPCPVADQPLPCWYIAENTATCAQTASHLEVHLARSIAPPLGTDEVVSCAAETL
jgi:hypothetical protein